MRAPRWKALFSSSDHAPNHVRARATLGAGAHLCCTRPALSTSEPATPRCSTQCPPRLSYGVRSTVNAACIYTSRAVATAVRTICASLQAFAHCTRRTVHAWASKSSLNVLRKRTKAGLRKSSFGHKASLCCTVALQMMRNQPSQLHGYSAQSACRMTGQPCSGLCPRFERSRFRASPSAHRHPAPSEALQTALDTPTPRTLHILEEDPFFTSDNHLWNRHCVVTAQCCVLHQGLG